MHSASPRMQAVHRWHEPAEALKKRVVELIKQGKNLVKAFHNRSSKSKEVASLLPTLMTLVTEYVYLEVLINLLSSSRISKASSPEDVNFQFIDSCSTTKQKCFAFFKAMRAELLMDESAERLYSQLGECGEEHCILLRPDTTVWLKKKGAGKRDETHFYLAYLNGSKVFVSDPTVRQYLAPSCEAQDNVKDLITQLISSHGYLPPTELMDPLLKQMYVLPPELHKCPL